MATNTKQLFTFTSDALEADTFTVSRFDGVEALSSLFNFDITLLAESPDIDLADLLRHPACLTIRGKEAGDLRYHGILSRCTLERPVGDKFLYQARLVPLSWRLSLIQHNQVFLNRAIPQIIDTVLRDGDLLPADFDFRLQGEYEPREYVCQYGESHHDFISRQMEQNGIYTFFDHLAGRDCLVITDTLLSHEEPDVGGKLIFSPDSGLDGVSKTKSVQRFTSVRSQVPGSVRLRDYNYRKPGLEMLGEAKVSEDGFGHIYQYGDHFQSSEEGQRLAAIRAEEQKWQEMLFKGESTAVGIQPGFLFVMSNHFREDLNGAYLCVDIEHHGRQDEDEQGVQKEGENWYNNTFTAIAADVQFRPQRKTPRPQFTGSLNAHIDGHGSGEYAELDEQGRYKVILPFDISGRGQGKASAWMRMMQPFTGQGYGMHFPLRKGSEVLLTFVDGNPDRPIISGAVPNPETRSVVDANNQDRSGFQTAGGSSFYSDDRPGHQHMLLRAGDENSGLRIGAGSDSSVAAWSSNLFMGGTAMSVVGSLLANYTFAAIQDTSITGWKFGLIMKVLEKFMLRTPRIVDKYDRANTDAAPNVIQNEVDLVTAVSATIEILVELYFIALTIKEMGAEGKAGESAYIVYSKEGETLVRNKAAGKHIYFYTETGDIYEEGINLELESGPEKENRVLLGSGQSNDEVDTRATVELMQGDVTIISGNLGKPGDEEAEEEEGDNSTAKMANAAEEPEESADGEESGEPGAVEPSGNEPPTADGRNFVKLVSGVKDDSINAQAMLELMQGDIVLTSGSAASADEEEEEELPPNSIWMISGEETAKSTMQLTQGDIEMVSGEGTENYIRLVSAGPGTEEAEETPEDSSTAPASDSSSTAAVAGAAATTTAEPTTTPAPTTTAEPTTTAAPTTTPAPADEETATESGGMAIIELKQGVITIQSGDGKIIISDGEVRLSGVVALEGTEEGNVMVDSDSKIILG